MKPELIFPILFVVDIAGYILTSRSNKEFSVSNYRYIPFLWILY